MMSERGLHLAHKAVAGLACACAIAAAAGGPAFAAGGAAPPQLGMKLAWRYPDEQIAIGVVSKSADRNGASLVVARLWRDYPAGRSLDYGGKRFDGIGRWERLVGFSCTAPLTVTVLRDAFYRTGDFTTAVDLQEHAPANAPRATAADDWRLAEAAYWQCATLADAPDLIGSKPLSRPLSGQAIGADDLLDLDCNLKTAAGVQAAIVQLSVVPALNWINGNRYDPAQATVTWSIEAGGKSSRWTYDRAGNTLDVVAADGAFSAKGHCGRVSARPLF